MKENTIGLIIISLGTFILIFGIILSIVAGIVFPLKNFSYNDAIIIEESYNWVIALIGSMASFITGICFIGFGEIINLLQKNINNQNQFAKIIAEQQRTANNADTNLVR